MRSGLVVTSTLKKIDLIAVAVTQFERDTGATVSAAEGLAGRDRYHITYTEIGDDAFVSITDRETTVSAIYAEPPKDEPTSDFGVFCGHRLRLDKAGNMVTEPVVSSHLTIRNRGGMRG